MFLPTSFAPEAEILDPTDTNPELTTMLVQGLGLNLSGLALFATAGTIMGPLGWSGAAIALTIKLIGDTQWVRAYLICRQQQH